MNMKEPNPAPPLKSKTAIGVIGYLDLLGLPVMDRVTEFTGIVTSISFDLYGCVQAVVSAKYKEEAKERFEARWFDCNRLKISDQTPVMDQPTFLKILPLNESQADTVRGAAEKPLPNAYPNG